MTNMAGFYLTVRRDNATGCITITFRGTLQGSDTAEYTVITASSIAMNNPSYWHMYVNSGSFKWYKGALVDPAGTATFADWDQAFDP